MLLSTANCRRPVGEREGEARGHKFDIDRASPTTTSIMSTSTKQTNEQTNKQSKALKARRANKQMTQTKQAKQANKQSKHLPASTYSNCDFKSGMLSNCYFPSGMMSHSTSNQWASHDRGDYSRPTISEYSLSTLLMKPDLLIVTAFTVTRL